MKRRRVPANFSALRSFFEKLRFRDGLVWTVHLTVEKKLCLTFQIASACRRDLKNTGYAVLRSPLKVALPAE